MLAARGLACGYGAVTVLEGIDLEVRAGEWLALLGPVGAGKTTLLAALVGLLRPTAGRMTIDNEPIDGLPPHQRLRRGLALVPEGRRLFAGMTVRENLLAGTHALDDAARRSANLTQVFELFPMLAERQRQIAGTLSGGEQQMLALARAYVQTPTMVLLDEVSMGLAPRVVDEIFEFLRLLAREGASLLLVEQYVTKALALADYVYLLHRGEIAFAGEPGELDGTDLFARYMGHVA
jgi:branched-chain amino acid transport system ATP-binding protein